MKPNAFFVKLAALVVVVGLLPTDGRRSRRGGRRTTHRMTRRTMGPMTDATYDTIVCGAGTVEQDLV